MRHHEDQESAAPKVQLLAAAGVDSNEPLEPVTMLVGGFNTDTGDVRPRCTREELIDCNLSETIPFFSSFLSNLGPRYQASNSDGLLFEMTPPGRKQLHNSDSDKTGFDQCNKSNGDGFAATVPELGNVTMIRSDLAAIQSTHDTSRRAVLYPMLEDFERNGLTSAYKPLLEVSSSGSTRGVLKGMPSTSTKRAICGRRINFDARSNSVESFLRTPHQISTSTLRELRGKEKELEDCRSSSVTPKRLRLDWGFQDSTRTAPAVLPSWRSGDFDDIIHLKHAQRCRVAAQRRRHRLMSPVGPVSRSKEAMDQTLITLRHWHFLLDLENPISPTIAFHIFNRAFRMFQRSRWPQPLLETVNDQIRIRVLMATAFWVAVKIVDKLGKVPRASAMASAASITARSLVHAELPLLDALQWQLVKY